MEKISTCLWFDDQAEEAANYYVSVFKNSKIGVIERYGEASANASGRPAGSVMSVTFTIEGRGFMGLNGGPIFQLSPAVSFMVNCKDQKEMDFMTEKLSAVPEAEQCGWVQDKFGVSWQIVPDTIETMMKDGDPAKKERMMAALMQMKRIDLAALQKAYDG